MRIYTKLFAVIAITAFLNIAALADTRIRFAKGRTSATVTGRVANGGRKRRTSMLFRWCERRTAIYGNGEFAERQGRDIRKR